MYQCQKNCLNCANSFSEPSFDENKPDVLHCMEHDGKVVDADDYCEDYN